MLWLRRYASVGGEVDVVTATEFSRGMTLLRNMLSFVLG